MEQFEWNEQKNNWLKDVRGISFEEVIETIRKKQVVDIINNQSEKYKHQKVYVLRINNYIYYVPFVENGNIKFLKTIIPNRKATKKFIKLQNL